MIGINLTTEQRIKYGVGGLILILLAVAFVNNPETRLPIGIGVVVIAVVWAIWNAQRSEE